MYEFRPEITSGRRPDRVESGQSGRVGLEFFLSRVGREILMDRFGLKHVLGRVGLEF